LIDVVDGVSGLGFRNGSRFPPLQPREQANRQTRLRTKGLSQTSNNEYRQQEHGIIDSVGEALCLTLLMNHPRSRSMAEILASGWLSDITISTSSVPKDRTFSISENGLRRTRIG
jgi:hypothetical protein